MHPKRSFAVLIGLLLALAATAQTRFTLDAVTKLVSVSDPQLSPDGRSVVIVVARPDLATNRNLSELVLVDVAAKKQRVLTWERPSVSQPRWSPDGSELAFLSRTASGMQLFVLPMQGGEARQLTRAPKGVQHYAWKPDGSALAYVTADEPANKTELEKGHTVFEVGNNDMFLGAQPTPAHIWLVAANGTTPAKRLTSGSWSLPQTIPPSAPASPLSWSPDGNRILFVRVPTPYSGDGQYSTIQLLNLADNSIRALTGRKRYEAHPSFSPDGQSILYWLKKGSEDRDIANINEVWSTTPEGGEGRPLTANLDRDLYRSIWMPDGKAFLTGGHDDNRTSMWIQNLQGKATRINTEGLSANWSFWVDAGVGRNGAVVFTATAPDRPVELYYLASASSKPVALTDFNREVRAMTFGRTETIYWENEGLRHSGIVTYPVNFDPSRKYPTVLVVHGGPNSASIETFARLPQLLANEGYLVFEPNYRGSDNLGSAYKMAISQDAGAGPGRDVMAGLEKLKRMGNVDSSRLAVSGWSYGGYMTVWLAGHYPVWKAAVAGAAVTDWVDQYNLSDANVARGGTRGGSPYTGDRMKDYVEQSPITAARYIKAPTLILANTGDPRVPITQSYKLFHSLKDNGVETKFFAWPIPAHNASDPVSGIDRDRLWINWLNTYLKKDL